MFYLLSLSGGRKDFAQILHASRLIVLQKTCKHFYKG